MGLESLSKIIGNRNFSSKRNSVELSLGEQLQDLKTVIESILACSSEIRDALFENNLSVDAFHHDVSVLEARVNKAVAALNEGVSEILRMKRGMLISLANHQAYKQYTDEKSSDI
jgi:DNA integrity scanning protein DisA with diadenylate cyclase activity